MRQFFHIIQKPRDHTTLLLKFRQNIVVFINTYRTEIQGALVWNWKAYLHQLKPQQAKRKRFRETGSWQNFSGNLV